MGGDAEARRPEAGAGPVGLRLVPEGAARRRTERVVRVVPDVAAVPEVRLRRARRPGRRRPGGDPGTDPPGAGAGWPGGWWPRAVDAPVGVALQPLAAVRGWGPPRRVVGLARWAAWRWAGPVSSFLGTASPPVAVRGLPTPAGGTSPARRRRRRPGPAGPPEPEPWAPIGEALPGRRWCRLPPAEDPFPLLVAAWGPAGRRAGRPGSSSWRPVPGRRTPWAAGCGGRDARRLLPEDWARARAGGCVAIGTRAAAFAPLPRLAAAVVLDAHDEVYHEERAPTWCAWEVVAERARREGVPCVLVSPCPTLDVLEAGPLVTGAAAVRAPGMAALEIVDRRGDDPRTGLFSERLVGLVRWGGRAPGRRVLCVVNRTGRVRLLACAACGELARCETGGAAVELVDPAKDGPPTGEGSAGGPARLSAVPALRAGPAGGLCRMRGGPDEGPRAGGARMQGGARGPGRAAGGRRLGPGGADAPARSRAGPSGPGASWCGTEAVLHRTGAADAVAFLDFDAELLAPRSGPARRPWPCWPGPPGLVAGSGAGPPSGRAPGRVLVQTRRPGHEAWPRPRRPTRAPVGGRAQVAGALELPPFSAAGRRLGSRGRVYGAALREAAPPRRGGERAGRRPLVGARRRALRCAICWRGAAPGSPAGGDRSRPG